MNKTTNKVAKSDLNIQKAIVSMDVKVSYKDIYKTVEVLREKGTTAVRHLYEVMNDVYTVYSLIQKRDEQKLLKSKTIKQRLNKLADEKNIERSSNIETALVRYVFGGLERRQVSKYAIAIKNAYKLHAKEIEESGDFAEWLKEIGGLTKLNSKPKIQVRNETFDKLFEQKPLATVKFDLGNNNVSNDDVCLLVCKKTQDGILVYGVDTNDDRVLASSKQAIANNETSNSNNWTVIEGENKKFAQLKAKLKSLQDEMLEFEKEAV